eukprot:9471303-Pyramimonas_sp.AAC.1
MLAPVDQADVRFATVSSSHTVAMLNAVSARASTYLTELSQDGKLSPEKVRMHPTNPSATICAFPLPLPEAVNEKAQRLGLRGVSSKVTAANPAMADPLKNGLEWIVIRAS